MEQVLTLTSPHTFSELYEELFKGRLLQFAAHPKANFVLQRLIGSCKEKEMVSMVKIKKKSIGHQKTLKFEQGGFTGE